MKRTIAEQMALRYAKAKHKDRNEIIKCAIAWMEGFKSAALFLEEAVDCLDFNDFLKGRKSIDDV